MASNMKNALGILFGVEGGGSISGASGKRIKKELDDIVAALNKGGGMKVELGVSSKEAAEATKKATTETNKHTASLKQAEKAYIAFDRARKTGYRTGGDEANEYYSRLRQSMKNAVADTKSFSATTDEMRVALSKNTLSASRQWDKYASNVRASILRVYDTISKDDASKKLADDLLKLTANGAPEQLEELKTKFGEFNAQVRQSGADVETWGQKFAKTFSGHIKTALAGLITGTLSKAVHDVYQNVVNLDKAMTDLSIASGKTREETRGLVVEYAKLGQAMGATATEVAASADTWLRQGYEANEANTLVANSMMLSKLGQIESEEASRALTSAMKGYNVTVEESIGIVDKLTSVDMIAATSAGDMATAMAETAASARLAGIPMEKLIGYIATVSEVTQDGAESVGVFYKSLFARMGNVKAGKYVDDETGESLNDVEKVLTKNKVAVRDSKNEFRDFADILDDVGRRWTSYDEVTQRAIATAMAGTKQQEKFIVLMENYGKAVEYANTALYSGGTAREKFEIYTNSIEGKLNALTAAWEEFSITLLDGDLLSQCVELLTGFVKGLTEIAELVDDIGGLPTILWGVVTTLGMLKYEQWTKALGRFINGFTQLGNATKLAGNEAALAQLKFGALMVVLGAVLFVMNKAQEEVDKAIAAHMDSLQENISTSSQHKQIADEVRELTDEFSELADNAEGAYDPEAAQRLLEIQEDITKLVGNEAVGLDLINGKYDDQLIKLREIERKQREIAKGKAEDAMKDAQNALIKQNAYNYLAPEGAISDWLGLTPVGNKAYALSTTNINRLNANGVSTTWSRNNTSYDVLTWVKGGVQGALYDGIQTEFDNMDDFVAQYEALKAMKSHMTYDAGNDPVIRLENNKLYDTVEEYLSDYQDIYDRYIEAKAQYDSLNNEDSDNGSGGGNDDTTKQLTQTKEELEGILDSYEKLIDLRKELLETYKKELEYEEELAKKQENVSTLSAKLALARLDTSAAGQARARELQAELDEANSDLDDFTLEHAIDVITSDLDAQADEFKAFIEQQISRITRALNGEEDPEVILNPQPTTPSTGKVPVTSGGGLGGGGKKSALDRETTYSLYHSGGFVGGLESNEEFAKLLKGEFVSTPAMMRNLVENTLPAIASYGGTQINSPLVNIQCGNITEDTLPQFQSAVDRAVKEIERKLDSGMSRTGFKHRVKALN